MNLWQILLTFLVRRCFVLVTIRCCVTLCGSQQLSGTACNGTLAAHESECDTFYKCDASNNWILMKCPASTMFNKSSGDCDIYRNESWCNAMKSLLNISATSAEIDTASSGILSSTLENTKLPQSAEVFLTTDFAFGSPSVVPTFNLSTTEDPRSICIIPCMCGTNLENTSLDEFMSKILSEMFVDRKKTSAYRRKYNSAKDNRPSAQSMGSLGIAVMVGVILLIILADLSNLFCKPTGMKKKIIY